MALVQDDDVVQTFPADGSDNPLDISILPRRSWRDQHLSYAHTGNAASKALAINAVSIAKDMAGCGIERKGFDYLLSRPCRRGMSGHIDMENATTIVPQNDNHIEDPKGCRRHGEEIDRGDIPKMIVQKAAPAL